MSAVPFVIRHSAFGIGLLIAQAQVAPDRVLVVIDQGHLSRERLPAMVRTIGELLRAAGGGPMKAAIVSGERVVYPDADAHAIASSLSGDDGFYDDLRRRHGVTESEAVEILRGNESVRDTVQRRLCASAAAACSADARAHARLAVEAVRELDVATVRSVKRILEDDNRPKTVVFISDIREPSVRSLGPLTLVRPGDAGDRLAAAVRPRPPAPPHAAGTPAATQLVDRATSHVLRFVTDASFLLADERYTQEVKSRAGSFNLPPTAKMGITVGKRQLESEVALVQVIDQQVWILARDVIRVDGRPVPDAERQPIPSGAATSLPDALAKFKEIAERGARFNIGPIQRNINVPTLALWFLTPGIRDLFDLHRDGEASVDGVRCEVVAYRERGEGILRVDGRPVPARGRFWIARDSGAVTRTELVLTNLEAGWPGRGQPAAGQATILVAYRFEPAVESWVPASMEERYEYPTRRDMDWVVGVATYSNYRRFTVGAKIVR